jgi:peptidoglycan/xylan/chitin deacetylase (PgdA/CDA1 family)
MKIPPSSQTRLTLSALAVIVVSSGLASAGWREALGLSPTPVERPPQFVLLAFDGSLTNSFWEESLTFGKENNIPFTYFMSGVYFLMNGNKSLYTEPTHGVGKSAIGWGGTNSDALTKRMEYLKRAYAEGNELGSHANGHFDGTDWTYDQWKFEFSQFPKLIFDAFANNGIVPPKDFALGFGMDEVKGFRAPLLGQNPAMYDVLAENGFHYDTSKTGPMDYWPQKQKGLWNFPLAEVGIAGTAKRTLSMDYNFYYAQSNGVDDPSKLNQGVYGEEMLQTYYNYFFNNYNGNRAPVHIGHHFAKWNGGVYWTAMKTFAKTVCALPEVRCVTYKELEDYMEARTPDEMEALAKGVFPKLKPTAIPAVIYHPQTFSLAASFGDTNGETVSAKLTGRDAAATLADPALVVVWRVDGTIVGQGIEVAAAPIRAKLKPTSVLSVSFAFGGTEILRTTRKITLNSFQAIIIDAADKESRALKGDLPEAHSGENAIDKISRRNSRENMG